MKSFGLSLLVLALGCAEPPPPPVVPAVTRQALGDPLELATPLALGFGAGAHLGASLAACPGGGWVAGGPVTAEAFSFPSGVRHLSLRSNPAALTSLPVACDPIGTTVVRRTASGSGELAELLPDGGRLGLDATHYDALATSRSGYPLAAGLMGIGQVVLFTSAGLPRWMFQDTAGFAASLAWNRNGGLVVGNPTQRQARLLFFDTRDGGAVTSSFVIYSNPDPGLPQSDFGRVVAAASVTNEFQEEVLISAPAVGLVYVYSGTSLLFTLDGGASFGSAIAIDPRPLGDGDLFAYWVSEPAQNLVHRFIGTERTTYVVPQALQNADLGAAMVFDDDANLVVGAPRFTEGGNVERGAVFSGPVELGVDAGEPATCSGQTCLISSDCGRGRCVGGVFCEYTGSSCTANERCDTVTNTCVPRGAADSGVLPRDAGSDGGEPDAGELDAGAPDAGHATDGGAPDAGATPDAGPEPTVDAGQNAAPGELSFTARGCSSVGGLWLGLVVLLARRRNPIE